MSVRRLLARLAPWSLAIAVAAVALLVVPARAEGPGYDGAADRLAVAWTAPDAAASADASSLPRTGVAPDEPALQVTGVGFRARSEVAVRVGSGPSVVVRVDETGTLRTAVATQSGATAGTGVSVVATGRAPSGTSKTLVGSIPAPAGGTGPVDLVPWVLGALAVVALAGWLVPRLSWRAPSGDAGLDLLEDS